MMSEKRKQQRRNASAKWRAKLTPEQKLELNRRSNDRRRPDQMAARRAWHRWYIEHEPAKRMFNHAKSRAKKLKVPFDLQREDVVIPAVCPALGIPLTRGIGKLHDGSPTLDRRVPEAGYIRGNVTVISHKANRIKNNATVLELEAVATWIRKL